MRYLLALLSVAFALPALGASQTRTSSFAYDSNTGLLIQEVVEPDTPAYRVQTDYSYDAYGNKLTVTVSGVDIATRTTTTVFDSNAQFPIKTTNALGQSDTGTYDARFGVPTSLTGPNGLTTTWSYDGFGRKINETRADGTQSNVSFNACDSSCPYNAKYYIATTNSGSPNSYVYYDMLNREMRSQAQSFDGRLVTKDTQYDSLGRVSQTSLPYYPGATVYWASVTYDQLSRPIQETQPDGSTNQTSYNGLTIVATNALGQTQTKVKNSQGQLVSVTDNQSNVISYQYDPFGNLTKTTDAKGNVVTLTYDLRGRKIAMNDPDMGSWTYQYDVLGQLIKQTDAKAQVVTMAYDILGRMLSRAEPSLNSTWTYDTAAMGVGKLAKVTSDNGFQRVYSYDSLGRVSTETSTIDTTYAMSKTYDVYGRTDVLTYPTGVKVKNVYNSYGYLAEVRNGVSNALFWRANAKDAMGHVINETLGNNLTTVRTYTATTGRISNISVGPSGTATIQNQTFYFDSLGNLTYRYDPIQGQSETFGYDTLNRLTTVTSGTGTISVTYDSIGNITSKNDVGAYTYGAQPHAVTQVTGTVNATYTYDANGNMTAGNGRSITYTSYNMPAWISKGASYASFIYDADHNRMRQNSNTESMIYLNPRIDVGAHFEKETKAGVVTYQHYIYGSAGVIGIYSTTSTTAVTRYFHTDHLGSIVAVTDDSATVIARYKFDAWGKRVLLAGDIDATHHGFTGHEHLDDVGLIHMNGRVYDPMLGRFASADPYIQAPDNLQSYNRYSYGWNNPLSGVDPSGFKWSFSKWITSGLKAAVMPTFKNAFNMIQNQPGQAYGDRLMLKNPALVQAAEIITSFIPVVGIFISAGISAYYTGLQGGGEWAMAKSFGLSLGMSYGMQQIQAGLSAGQDLQLYRVDMASDGTWARTVIDTLPQVGDIPLGVNGLENTLDQAMENLGKAANAANLDTFYMAYNRSQSFIADLAQSGQDVLFSGSAASRQLAGLVNGPLSNGATVTLFGHSQGAAIVYRAASYLQQAGAATANLTISAFGAPINEATFRGLGINVGYFKVNPYDAVTTIVGRNATGLNSVAGSMLNIPKLFSNTGSPHGAYNYFP